MLEKGARHGCHFEPWSTCTELRKVTISPHLYHTRPKAGLTRPIIVLLQHLLQLHAEEDIGEIPLRAVARTEMFTRIRTTVVVGLWRRLA